MRKHPFSSLLILLFFLGFPGLLQAKEITSLGEVAYPDLPVSAEGLNLGQVAGDALAFGGFETVDGEVRWNKGAYLLEDGGKEWKEVNGCFRIFKG